MKLKLTAMLIAAVFASGGFAAEQKLLNPKTEKIDISGAKWALGKYGKIEQRDGKSYLTVKVPEKIVGVHCPQITIDLSKYADKRVQLNITVRGKDIKKAKPGWNGPKFMMVFPNVFGDKVYPGAGIPLGTFDWKQVSVGTEDAPKTTEVLFGFQNATGELEYDLSSLTVTVSDLPPNRQKITVKDDVILPGGIPVEKMKWNLPAYTKMEGNVLTVTVPESGKDKMNMAKAKVNLSAYAGKEIQLSLLVRGENISIPKRPWNGVKTMLVYKRPGEKDVYISPKVQTGTFGWKLICVGMPVSPECPEADLRLGLQESSGKVEFDLSTLKLRVLRSLDNAKYQAEYTPNVRTMERRRGVMLPQGDLTEADLVLLKKWNVNLVRFQICRKWGKKLTDRDLADYDKWFHARLDNLDFLLKKAPEYGIKVVIDMHTPPGGRRPNNDMSIFHETYYTAHCIKLWTEIARRFKGNPAVWAYDLINEPQARKKNGFSYWEFQLIAAEEIRKIDPDTPIVVATNWGNGPWSYPEMKPLEMKNIIYQVHMYNPMAYTHQFRKINGKFNSYPGVMFDKTGKIIAEKNGTPIEYNRERLKLELKNVRDFQLKHNVRIYCGEFSAAIWLPGADRYLADVVSIFEEYGWDWSYHSFREAPCWSLEMETSDSGKTVPSVDNPRKRVILEAFRKNKR